MQNSLEKLNEGVSHGTGELRHSVHACVRHRTCDVLEHVAEGGQDEGERVQQRAVQVEEVRPVLQHAGRCGGDGWHAAGRDRPSRKRGSPTHN